MNCLYFHVNEPPPGPELDELKAAFEDDSKVIQCGNGGNGRWFCTCLASGEVFEFFDEEDADKARESGLFKVEGAIEYLGRINREAKDGQTK